MQYFMDEPFGGIPLIGMNVLNKEGEKIIYLSR